MCDYDKKISDKIKAHINNQNSNIVRVICYDVHEMAYSA